MHERRIVRAVHERSGIVCCLMLAMGISIPRWDTGRAAGTDAVQDEKW